MKFKQAFLMSLKSIASNKIRSFLTMLGIIIGVAAVIVLVSLVQGYQSSMMEYYDKQGVNKITVYAYSWGGNSKKISEDLFDFCLDLDDLVLGVTPNSTLWGKTVKYQAKKAADPQIAFGNEYYSICNNYELESGRDLCYIDIKHSKRVCVIGSAVRDALFDFADPVGKKITIDGESFTVVGTFVQKYDDEFMNWFDNIVVIPYTLMRTLSPGQVMDSYVVKAASKSSTTEAITRLSGFLRSRIDPNRGYYDVYSENTFIEEQNQMTRMIQLVLGGIAGIALLVGGIGIMNIMLVTVTERTREIGIRKAIGAKRSAIITQFLIESSVVSLLGGILGIVFGVLLTLVLGKLIFDLVIYPGTGISIGAAAFSIVIGIIFGMYPAVKASKLQPVAALRAE
ncbi:MAG: ABC transporter permease [Oscillospiraceae bacterium]|jgi:putative ABC transport system permease protein